MGKIDLLNVHFESKCPFKSNRQVYDYEKSYRISMTQYIALSYYKSIKYIFNLIKYSVQCTRIIQRGLWRENEYTNMNMQMIKIQSYLDYITM